MPQLPLPETPQSRINDKCATHIAAAKSAQEQRCFAEAFEHFFLALLADPSQVEVAINLGSLCRQWQWYEYGELFYRHALEIAEPHLFAIGSYNYGNLCRESGRLADARTHYEAALSAPVTFAAASHALFELAVEAGDAELANSQLELMDRHSAVPDEQVARLRSRLAVAAKSRTPKAEFARLAIYCRPVSAKAWRSYLHHADETEPWWAMLDMSVQAIAHAPYQAFEIATAIIRALISAGEWSAVETCVAQLASILPAPQQLYVFAAQSLFSAGRFEVARRLCRHPCARREPNALLLELDANCHVHLGLLDDARLLFGRAIRLDPQNPTILTNASRLLFLRGEINSAVYIAERAVDAASDKVVPYGNLAKLLQKTHNLRDSLAVLSQALSLPMPARSRAGLHQLRGNLFLTRAQHAEAIAEYRRAADLAPETTSALAMARTYCDDATAAELGHLHRAAAAQLLQVVSGRARTVWHNGRDPNRKLRIGIVSADLVHHPVGLILASWLRHVDRQQFDVFCYHISPRKDEITARLASAVSDWRDAVGLDTAEIADMVESDSIDILMDVGGYTEGSPLAIFALKPAPLQLSWAGYIFSSGLTKIDGIIHDRYTAPPALDRHYTEEIIRLGCMPYCYEPQEPPPPVAPTPALARGYVTFGSFNNPSKLTDRTLSLWTAVLRAVPLSRLLLKSGAFGDPETVQMFCDRFERLGIGRDRLQFAGGSYFTDYLRAYDEVDIALDPLPFNGGITSLQGLWQGVPVLSRCGELYAGRVGGAIMHALSLSSWVTESDEQFVRAALVNTADFASLNRLRQQMRDRLRACTIGNGRLFARRMEQLWRNKWYEHCRR